MGTIPHRIKAFLTHDFKCQVNCPYINQKMSSWANIRSIALGVLFTLFVQVHADLLVQTRNGTQIVVEATEIIYFATAGEKISLPISAEVTMNRTDIRNKLYLLKSSLSIDEIILEVQNNGAVGVLCVSGSFYVPGLLKYRYTNQKYIDQIKIPVFEIGMAVGAGLLDLSQSDEISNVTLIPSNNSNPWDEIFYNPGYRFWVVFVAVFGATNIGLAIWKLKIFIEFYGGFRTSIACYVLLIELISNVLRIIYMINLACFNAFPQRVSDIFSIISYPFAFASYLLFTLYWHEIMTTSSVVVHPFIVKMRIPFYTICALLLALDIVRIILIYTSYWDGMAQINSVITMVLLLALIGFYLATTIKLLKRLKKSKSSGRKVQLKQTTIKVCIGVGFLFIFLLLSVLFVTRITYYPHVFTVCWYSIFTLLNGASMMNILAFELMANGSSKSNGKKTSSKPGGGGSAQVESSNPSA